MSIFVVLNILIITDMCLSFKPNFYNGRYFHGELKTQPLNQTTASSSTSPRVETFGEVHRHNSSSPRNYASRITSDGTRKLINSDDQTSNEPISFPNQFPPVERQPYKSGSISDLLSRYESSPVVLVNKPGNYQTQLTFENPTTTSTATPETVTATSLKTEIYHPPRASTTLRKAKRFDISESTNSRTPVRAVKLNTQVYHRPQETNIDDKSDRPLMRPAAIVLYNQTIVHINEPKYLHTPSPLRKPRILREISVDKLIEHKKGEGNETQYEDEDDVEDDADADDGANDDSGDVGTEAEAEADSAEDASSHEQLPLAGHEMRYMHDIFLNYPKNHQANYGHVQLTPELFEKRFETTKEGNRYKGEVLWMDNKGGYAQHYWNLALGKL